MAYNTIVMKVKLKPFQIINKIKNDDLPGYAAQSSYFILLSFFPFITLLLSLIHYLPLEYDVLMQVLNDIVPEYFKDATVSFIGGLYYSSSISFTGFSAIITLWAAGRGFMSLMKGFNAIHGIVEDRNFIVRRAISSVQTLLFIIIIAALLVFVVFGNKLLGFTSKYFPYIAIIIEAVIDIKWLFFPALLTLAFLFMFKFIPSRRLPLFAQLPGAVISSVGWYGFSLIFAVYVNNNTYSAMFGGLGTLILALVWLYSCMMILFFGAEFNSLISHDYVSAQRVKR